MAADACIRSGGSLSCCLEGVGGGYTQHVMMGWYVIFLQGASAQSGWLAAAPSDGQDHITGGSGITTSEPQVNLKSTPSEYIHYNSFG